MGLISTGIEMNDTNALWIKHVLCVNMISNFTIHLMQFSFISNNVTKSNIFFILHFKRIIKHNDTIQKNTLFAWF